MPSVHNFHTVPDDPLEASHDLPTPRLLFIVSQLALQLLDQIAARLLA